MTATVLWLLPAWIVVLAVLAVPAGRRWGSRAGYVLAAAVVPALVAVAALGRVVAEGGAVSVSRSWIPALGGRVALRLDALSLLFVLLVLGIGVAVLAYSPRYLQDGTAGRPSRFYAAMLTFAAGMLVLVLADDLLLLYAGWEATTLTSFLLIGHERAGRAAARRALLMTFAGGLALLGAALLAAASAGTLAVATLTDPAAWPSGARVFLVLLLVAASAKSAQVPFHDWLPGAMVAPTPVSAYLHAAAMVNAGIYLLLRFGALLASDPGVAAATTGVGAVTAVVGAATAVRRTDLKQLLAYSTISQLGFMFVLVGLGTAVAIAAALVHVVAHALYKGGLFLVAGIVDHHRGTRDLHDMGGLRRELPLTSGSAAVCAASMAGVPPLLGFISKDQGLTALLAGTGGMGGTVVVVAVVAALVLTVAYAVRAAAPFLLAGPTGSSHEGQALAPAVLAVGSLGFGLYSSRLASAVERAASVVRGEVVAVELGLWHGPTPALWTSVGVVVAGTVLWWLTRRTAAPARRSVTDRVLVAGARAGRRLAGPVDRVLSNPAPSWHLGLVLLLLAGITLAGAWGGAAPSGGDSIEAWGLTALLVLGSFAAVRARGRLALVAVLGAIGFLVAAYYVLHGGPDLALTQILVDALTVAVIVFVFRGMPREYPSTARVRVVLTAVVAGCVGIGLGAAAYVSSASSVSPAAQEYLRRAPREDAGNVVNAVLTDFRALDTLGETGVLAVAAIGVVVVVRGRRGSP